MFAVRYKFCCVENTKNNKVMKETNIEQKPYNLALTTALFESDSNTFS